MFGWVSGFFTYETTKSVLVKSWLVGVINRVAQLLIIIYFVGWVFVHEKAYQVHDTGIESAVMTKVKGFGFFNNSLMDVADYVKPTQGGSVFCIITSMIITANQTQNTCPEKDRKFECKTDYDCEKHVSSNLASGKITGRCITEDEHCEILGWCPAEDDKLTEEPMEVENFTVLIKNSIRFPLFRVTRGNFGRYTNGLNCLYDPSNNSDCPIFRVGDVLKYAGEDLSETNITKKGGEIGINIAWVCNLDLQVDKCKPKYTFTRLDSAFKNSSVTQGYNFRFAKYFRSEDGQEFRTLYKAFAIRFDILVSGNAGKFHLIPTVINVVAACTSVGLATVLCDIILLNFVKGAKQYKARKFEQVSDFVSLSQSLDLHHGSQTTIKWEEKSSDDSGAYSIGHAL